MKDNRRLTFSLEEVLLGIVDFDQKRWFQVEHVCKRMCYLQKCSFSLIKMLIAGLEWCGLLVDY